MSNNDSSGSDAQDAVGKVRKSADRKNSAVRRVAQAADTGDKRDRSLTNRLGFPAIVGLVTVLGLALVIYAWATRDPKASPAVGEHWHAVYGVYDCTLNNGEGAYLPAFQSTVDEVGIHSHQDGIMHVHPWYDRSDGPDARIEHFLDSMQVSIEPDSIILESGQVLREGADCNGEPAIVQVHKWQFWFEATAGDKPQVFTEDLEQLLFENDREVYIIALAPEGAELPLPPSERFDQLEAVSPIITSSAPVLEEADQNFSIPEPTVEPGDG